MILRVSREGMMKLMKVPRPAVHTPRAELEHIFDRFLTPALLRDAPLIETEWAPALDFSEMDNEYIVRLEAPGVHRENLDVNLEGQMLTLTGKREVRRDLESEDFIWKEREEGHFVRSIRLPKAVDMDKVVAAYQDGVLIVHLPKLEPAVKSKIAIK
jgi:HSP20 family protein